VYGDSELGQTPGLPARDQRAPGCNEQPDLAFTITSPVQGMDFSAAGDAAAKIKRALSQVGLPGSMVRRAAIAAYEAEMNIVIHAYSGTMTANISCDGVQLIAEDCGPGIPDVNLAMQEGYSTAPSHVQEMGFGAGMGLPNIRNCADEMDIVTEEGVGTKITVWIRSRPTEARGEGD